VATLHSYEEVLKNWGRYPKVMPKNVTCSKVSSKAQAHCQKARFLCEARKNDRLGRKETVSVVDGEFIAFL
jgi:hypothetical protein